MSLESNLTITKTERYTGTVERALEGIKGAFRENENYAYGQTELRGSMLGGAAVATVAHTFFPRVIRSLQDRAGR